MKFYWHPSKIIFCIGDFYCVSYYGLFLLISFFLSLSFAKMYYEKELNWYSFIIQLAIFSFIGGRIGFFVFYKIDTLFNNPFVFLYFWHGGLSSHGSLIAIIIYVIFYNGYQSKFKLLDISLKFSLVGGFFIRIANFFNSEKIGIPTSGAWGVIFINNSRYSLVPRHPTQIYEAIFCLLLLVIFSLKKDKTPGQTSAKILILLFSLRLFTTLYLFENSNIIEIILNCFFALVGLILFFNLYYLTQVVNE